MQPPPGGTPPGDRGRGAPLPAPYGRPQGPQGPTTQPGHGAAPPGQPPGGPPPHGQPAPQGYPPAHGQPQPNPYAQPQPNPYGQPQPNPYAQPQPNPYAQPQPNPYAQPQPNPYAQPQPNPYPQPNPNPNPYPQPHAQPPHPQPHAQPPHAQPQANPYSPQANPYSPQANPYSPQGQPHAPPPGGHPPPQQQQPPYGAPGHLPHAAVHQPGAPAPPSGDHSFSDFLSISLKRAFRLRIEHDEVTPAERVALERAGVTEPTFQAFLSWRRSMVFAFATLIIPLMALKAYELFGGSTPQDPIQAQLEEDLRNLQSVPLVAEVVFCILAWTQLSRWTSWRKQRRTLLVGWLIFFLAPFAVFMVPIRELMPAVETHGDPSMQQQVQGAQMMLGLAGSLLAMMQLAPKAVSLVAGMIRGSIVTKLLFPGASAPGWLMVIGAVFYAMFVYVFLIVPFQITGSYWFLAAVIAIVIGEYLLAKGGYRLAKPMTRDDAIAGVKKARGAYFIALASGVFCIVMAMAELIEQMPDFSWLTVVNLIGTFLANVWILTVITTDLLIDSLDRARGLTAGGDKLEQETEQQLGAFVGVRTVAPGSVQIPEALRAPAGPPGPPR